MATLQDPDTPTQIAKVDLSRKALRVAQQPVQGLAHYSLSVSSGLLASVGAGTATAGHLWSLRVGSATHLMVIQRWDVKWRTLTGFTSAQEMALAGFFLTGYSSPHTGGNLLVLTDPQFKRRTDFPDTVIGSSRIGDTAALTAGTHTLNTNEFFRDSYAELAAAATVQKGRIDTGKFFGGNEQPIVLGQNQGLIVRNEIGMGLGGVGRLTVELDWFEILAADYAV